LLLKVSYNGHSLVRGGDGGGGCERSRLILRELLLKVSWWFMVQGSGFTV